MPQPSKWASIRSWITQTPDSLSLSSPSPSLIYKSTETSDATCVSRPLHPRIAQMKKIQQPNRALTEDVRRVIGSETPSICESQTEYFHDCRSTFSPGRRSTTRGGSIFPTLTSSTALPSGWDSASNSALFSDFHHSSRGSNYTSRSLSSTLSPARSPDTPSTYAMAPSCPMSTGDSLSPFSSGIRPSASSCPSHISLNTPRAAGTIQCQPSKSNPIGQAPWTGHLPFLPPEAVVNEPWIEWTLRNLLKMNKRDNPDLWDEGHELYQRRHLERSETYNALYAKAQAEMWERLRIMESKKLHSVNRPQAVVIIDLVDEETEPKVVPDDLLREPILDNEPATSMESVRSTSEEPANPKPIKRVKSKLPANITVAPKATSYDTADNRSLNERRLRMRKMTPNTRMRKADQRLIKRLQSRRTSDRIQDKRNKVKKLLA